jgi:putative colanic acid biosynthesis UDP-glucose lipid carrier transferase
MRLIIDRPGPVSAGFECAAPAQTESQLRQRRLSLYRPACSLRKRLVDVFAACCCLILLSPLLILVALVIRIESRGPVIFRQTRTGCHGKIFQIYKLRTMTVLEDGADVKQVAPNDARVTRLGLILRKTSIDELPQLINVILGDMSLVGPRPHALAHDAYYSEVIDIYDKRFAVPPGITGLAQVSGCRGGTPEVDDMRRRVEFDLAYIENWSLRLDMRILLRTIRQVLRDQHAY